MRKLPFHLLLIALSVFSILFSGINVMLCKKIWSGDETISYLCATGNQEQFTIVAEQNLTEVQSTTVWKKLFVSQNPYCFQKIATDLSISDLHPPLYFWILHVYLIQFGFSIHAGIVLNLLFHLLSLGLVYAFTRKVGLSQMATATVCLIWSVSPAALNVDFYARQYELLGLIHLLYAYCFWLWFNAPSKTNVFALVLICTLGFLTHYSFIYIVAGYGLFALIHTRTIGFPNLIALSTTFIIAGLCLFLFHPHFAHQFMLQQQRAQPFDLLQTGARLGKTILTFLNFCIPLLLLKPFLLKLSNTHIWTFAAVSLLSISAVCWINRTKLNRFIQTIFRHLKKPDLPVWMTILMSAVTIIPYLLCITPFHAMGAQYLVCLYPFMAMLLYRVIRSSRTALIIGIMVMVSGSLVSLMIFKNRQSSYTPLTDAVKKSDRIIYDKADRRNIGRLVPFFPEQGQVQNLQKNVFPSEHTSSLNTMVLISAYEKPEKLEPCQQYYDFDDHGGFVVWKPAEK